jgi:hypothetical protein
MEFGAEISNVANDTARAATTDTLDLSFLPQTLSLQCQGLIESCLPDMLWKAQLGGFIEMHPRFRQILRKASTTRSAKKSNQGFVQIATAILSLEILASDFARWSAIFPEAKLMAQAVLRGIARGSRTPLMECYLYPPKYISSAALAALALPPNRQAGSGAQLNHASLPELSGEKLALNYANTMHEMLHGKSAQAAPALPASSCV